MTDRESNGFLFQDMRNHLSKDRTFVIHVQDRNDNVPKFSSDIFTGQIEEELDMVKVSKTTIVNVVAKDNDHVPAFREVCLFDIFFLIFLHFFFSGNV